MTRKLSPEERALIALAREGSIVPGDAAASEFGGMLVGLLRSLVKKGRATDEMTDDGPRWTVTAAGRQEAEAIERGA
jgi:hypothetical protein